MAYQKSKTSPTPKQPTLQPLRLLTESEKESLRNELRSALQQMEEEDKLEHYPAKT